MDESLLQNLSAREIVAIVHELHQKGFGQLRLYSGLSPSGTCWRWFIYPKAKLNGNWRFERDDFVPFECFHGSTDQLHWFEVVVEHAQKK